MSDTNTLPRTEAEWHQYGAETWLYIGVDRAVTYYTNALANVREAVENRTMSAAGANGAYQQLAGDLLAIVAELAKRTQDGAA